MVAYSLVTVSLPFRFQELGLSVVQYGTVLAVYALGMLATESLWGALAFRIGRPGVLLGLGAALTLVILGIGGARTFLEFVAVFGLLGILFIFPIPLSRWLSLTARGPGTAGAGTGRYGLFFGIGLVAGTSVGPLVFVEVGFVPLVLASLALSAVATTLFALVPWRDVPIPVHDRGVRRQAREVLRRHFVLCAGLVAVYFVAYCLTINFLQYYSVSLFGGTPSAAGYAIGAARTVTLTAGFLLGPVIDRWSPARSAPLGFLGMAAGALVTFFATNYSGMVAATLLFSAGSGCLSASLLPLALGPIPRPAQGTAVGIFGSFEDLGLLLGPILIGEFYATYGPRSIFPLVAGIAGFGGVMAVLIPKWLGAAGKPSIPSLPKHA